MGRFLLLLILLFVGVAWFSGDLKLPAPVAVQVQPPDRPAPGTAPTFTSEGLELRRQPGGHFLAEGTVNGQRLSFVVDTGATAVALTVADARRAGIAVNPAEFRAIGVGASGPVRGQPILIDRVEVAGREVRRVPGAVIEGLQFNLLGQSYLSQLEEVSLRGDRMVLR